MRFSKVERMIFMVVCALGAAAPAQGQMASDLVAGARVRLQTADGTRLEGRLVSAPDTSFELVNPRGSHSLGRRDVTSVELYAGKSRSAGMLSAASRAGMIGAAVGGVLGVITYEPCDSHVFMGCFMEPRSRGAAGAFGAVTVGVSSAVIGGLVGWIRGADSWKRITLP